MGQLESVQGNSQADCLQHTLGTIVADTVEVSTAQVMLL